MTCPIRPLSNQVVIDRFDEDAVTEGGIIRPTTQLAQRGKVLAIGPGKRLKNGARIPVNINVGDVIQYRPHASVVKHFIDGKKYIVVNEDEILAVLECAA